LQQDLLLLGPDDPSQVSIVYLGGLAPVLLICYHASNPIPAALDGLGLVERELHRHVAFELGAAEVTQLLGTMLDALIGETADIQI